MKTSNAILRRDFHRLRHNVAALLVLAGICLLPSLYAWFNIGANMDPYGNIDRVKIAVVDLDRPVEYGERQVDVGKTVLENLKKNDQLGWTFVDENRAIGGVRSGAYYAAIVIPEDFSASFLSIVKGEEIQFPTLNYYVNEKKNAIAPKITSSGLEALEEQINSNFVATTSEILADELAKLSGDFIATGEVQKDSALHALTQVQWNVAAYGESLRNMDEKLARMDSMTAAVRADIAGLDAAVKKGQISLAESRTLLENIRRESENVLAAYDDIVEDINAMANVGNAYTGRKYTALDGELGRIENRFSIGLQNFQEINALNRSILGDLESIDPLPAESKPLNVLEQWQNINARNGTILADIEKQSELLDDALGELDRSHGAIQKRLRTVSDENNATRDKVGANVRLLLEQNFDMLNRVNARFSGTLSSMPLLLDEFDQVLEEMEYLTKESRNTVAAGLESLASAEAGIEGLRTDLAQLGRGPLYEKLLSLPNIDAKRFSAFMGDPVVIEEHTIYKSDNYGSAMAPFFTDLALWVGGMILISILKIDVDKDEEIADFTAADAFLGRWKLFVILGQIQALVVSVGDLWLLKVQCVHPVLFVLTTLISSFAYVSIIYALTVTFRNIGKAMAVILLILQIPGSSGTYPIEMMSNFFRSLYPFLPFHYGIDGLRETMLGIYTPHFLQDWGILISYVPLSFLLGIYGPKLLRSVSRTFDAKLAESELIHAEYPHEKEPIRGDFILALLAGDEAEKEKIRQKHARFFHRYERKKTLAFLSIFAIPLVFLVLMFSMESKIRYLVIWVVTIILLAIYLIVLELRRFRYRRQQRLMAMDEDELLLYVKGNDAYEDDF
ncbi:YhgE/Pip C-terminal domain [Aedoeadaptatus ivorii]|uniref:YhgE/Pip C-terminal domain n=1 Tax=Aedoeadaptatus ivorii TaxID=54006 RepID=A0A448UZU8_9FIRM|nr:YhgE/Pip domain-containing protein [Peptoniphilus ivorii]VEJ34507.1 YhgE/Pip C-terminal domain [Peptoniphilus ivorii]